ncbi:MAG: EAL domain-containing protein [Mycobacteriales bacterium]
MTASYGEIAAGLDRDSEITLLLIEDSEADAEFVQALLEDELPGTRVTACTTLRQAREHLQRQDYDVVMADLALPDADGLAVVEAVRDRDKASALLVLTGRDDSILAMTALAQGAQDYLVKGQHDGPRLATAVLHAMQRQRVERAAHVKLQLALLDALEAPTCAVGSDSRIVAVNKAWRALATGFGHRPERSGEGRPYLEVGQLTAVLPGAGETEQVAAGLRDVLAGRVQRYQREYPCARVGAQQRWFSVRISPAEIDGSPGAVITHVDVTEMRQVQQALSHQVLHDVLTGLPNRLLLGDRLRQALADSARRGTHVAVAFIDIDHFKRVNDNHGHPAGDALLVEVAGRLQRQIRAVDTLARVSGDEFVVVWQDLTDPAEAELLSDRLSTALSGSFDLGSASVTVSASVGVVVGRAPQSPEELLQAADAAMYEAKQRGGAQVGVFTAQLRQDIEERNAIETGLRRALTDDELVLHYQPVVDLTTGQAVGVEALVRWQHPQHGLIGPDRFIPVAESSGLIVPLGRWVLQRACRQAASWTGLLAGLHVAVNLSARELTHCDVLDNIRQALKDSGLAAQRLVLEVTETTVMEDTRVAGAVLDALSDLGVRISVDDFGTGYSSLLYLRRYPISALKVDRTFVSGIGVTIADDAICNSVISLAKAVGTTSIAEGVETIEQYTALRRLGCEQAQGFLWSPAVPASQLPEVLARCSSLISEP